MSRTWTDFQLTDNMLKQLSAGASRENGSVCPGRGHGAAAGRYGLYNRGLITIDNKMTVDGHDALEQARKEGW